MKKLNSIIRHLVAGISMALLVGCSRPKTNSCVLIFGNVYKVTEHLVYGALALKWDSTGKKWEDHKYYLRDDKEMWFESKLVDCTPFGG